LERETARAGALEAAAQPAVKCFWSLKLDAAHHGELRLDHRRDNLITPAG
jgi:hypothetical protein